MLLLKHIANTLFNPFSDFTSAMQRKSLIEYETFKRNCHCHSLITSTLPFRRLRSKRKKCEMYLETEGAASMPGDQAKNKTM